jgi:hypothetical protein
LFGVKTIPNNLSKSKLLFFDLFLYVHPILIVALIWWYTAKPFNQIILLPQGYTGVVVIDYDKKDGQEKKWMNRFLGIGGSRLIKIDTNGYAKTKFKYSDRSIPIFNIQSGNPDLEDIQIYYENNLHTEIRQYLGNDDVYTDNLYKQLKKNNSPVAYFTEANDLRNIFVVCRVKDYYHYFYTEDEIKNIQKESETYFSFENALRKKYVK